MKGNYLGEVASVVLTVIAVAEETNANEIMDLLQQILYKPPYKGVIYNTLKRLEEEGLIKSEKASLERVDKRVRKSYTLTQKGERQFNVEQHYRQRLKQIAKEKFNKTIF